MLFAIIDLIERVLRWLKPFAQKERPESRPRNDYGDAIPAPPDFPSEAQNSYDEILSTFGELINDKTINSDPKILGAISNFSGQIVIGPVKANAEVWSRMFRAFSDRCYIKTFGA